MRRRAPSNAGATESRFVEVVVDSDRVVELTASSGTDTLKPIGSEVVSSIPAEESTADNGLKKAILLSTAGTGVIASAADIDDLPGVFKRFASSSPANVGSGCNTSSPSSSVAEERDCGVRAACTFGAMEAATGKGGGTLLLVVGEVGPVEGFDAGVGEEDVVLVLDCEDSELGREGRIGVVVGVSEDVSMFGI